MSATATEELLGELKSTWEDFKQANEQAEGERKKIGEEFAESKQTLGKINDRLDEIETSMKAIQRPGKTDGPESKDDDPNIDPETKAARQAERKAFVKYLRKGENSLSPEEQKSLALSDDTTGGFLAPDEYVQEIIKGIVLYSPIREVARVRQTSRNAIKIPKRTGLMTAQWTAEQGTRSETTGLTWGMEEIPTHELYALVDVSMQDLEDSVFDLEAEINEAVTEQLGVAEGTAFVTGNGVGKPEGYATAAAGVPEFNTAGSGVVTADDLIKAYFTPKTAYVRDPSCCWLMNRTTIRTIRQLKDSSNNYLWNPGINGFATQSNSAVAGIPPTILDKPYVETVDQADIATGAYAISFGAWRRGFVIVDRISEVQMLRDPYTQATSGNVRFIMRKRVGGQVVLPEALVNLKVL